MPGIAIQQGVLDAKDEFVNAVVQHEAIHEILQLADHGCPICRRRDTRPQRFEQCR